MPPELMAQITAERRNPSPLSYTFLSDWLAEEHNIEVAPGSLRNHVETGHDGVS